MDANDGPQERLVEQETRSEQMEIKRNISKIDIFVLFRVNDNTLTSLITSKRDFSSS